MQEMSYLKINPLDNVAVALVDLECGFTADINGVKVVLKEDIGRGHKFAIENIAQNANVIKYGSPIGHATADITPGEWVHTRNIKTNLSGVIEYSYKPEIPEEKTAVIYHALTWRVLSKLSDEEKKKDPYILYSGVRGGYKNFERFVRAAAPLLTGYDLKLLCTGHGFSNEEQARVDFSKEELFMMYNNIRELPKEFIQNQ